MRLSLCHLRSLGFAQHDLGDKQIAREGGGDCDEKTLDTCTIAPPPHWPLTRRFEIAHIRPTLSSIVQIGPLLPTEAWS